MLTPNQLSYFNNLSSAFYVADTIATETFPIDDNLDLHLKACAVGLGASIRNYGYSREDLIRKLTPFLNDLVNVVNLDDSFGYEDIAALFEEKLNRSSFSYRFKPSQPL